MMKSFLTETNIWSLFVVLLLVLVPACTLPSKFEVFNNTGVDIRVFQVITANTKTVDLAPATSMVLEHWDASGGGHFTVVAGDKRWHYRPGYISHHFGDLKRLSHWLFRLQIEKDGSVFVLGPDEEFSQTDHVPQPEGYPLRPTDENV